MTTEPKIVSMTVDRPPYASCQGIERRALARVQMGPLRFRCELLSMTGQSRLFMRLPQETWTGAYGLQMQPALELEPEVEQELENLLLDEYQRQAKRVGGSCNESFAYGERASCQM